MAVAVPHESKRWKNKGTGHEIVERNKMGRHNRSDSTVCTACNEAAAATMRTHHKSTMRISQSDARAIVEGRRTKWNSLELRTAVVNAPQAPAKAQSPESEGPQSASQESFSGNVIESTFEIVGAACLGIVAIPILAVSTVLILPALCLTAL
jgi:hypothetical protein